MRTANWRYKETIINHILNNFYRQFTHNLKVATTDE